MGQAEIAAELKTIIAGVAGMGQVYKRQRYSSNWQTFLQLFEADGKINGCMLGRKTTAKQQHTMAEVERAHVFVIRLYYGLQDSADSETFFQDLVDQVAAALDVDETLNASCETTHPDFGPMSGTVGAQIDLVDLRQFGKVLCHYAEIRICAQESVAL